MIKIKRSIEIKEGNTHLLSLWKTQKHTSTNHKSSNTYEGDTTAVATNGDVLFIVSVEDACLCTSSSRFDWILEYGAYHHVTP